jgi:hemerythrin-like metal-binding protein
MSHPTERRRHRRFRLLFIDIKDFVRRFILKRHATHLVAGPRPDVHSPRSGSGLDPSLATGIEQIDRQHQELTAAARRFQEAVQAGSGFEVLTGTMESMIRYAEDHFTLEEAYMAHIKYPHLPAHREDHARLRARISYLQQRVAGGGDLAKVLELSAQLCKYVRDHIVKEDAAYAEFARNAGPKG